MKKLNLNDVIVLGITVLLAVFFTTIIISSPNKVTSEKVYTIIVNANTDEFSEEVLISKLKALNIKFPYVVVAQARLESQNYRSTIFKENNNLFGMKKASIRPTTALGEKRGHAYYLSWETSVLDYALYQTAYLRKLKTEKAYIDYLSKHYAEDPKYGEKIKELTKQIKKEYGVT